jgi:hypothetical protein
MSRAAARGSPNSDDAPALRVPDAPQHATPMPHPGFNHPDFHGEIVAELQPRHASDAVRMIDALALHRLTPRKTSGATAAT